MSSKHLHALRSTALMVLFFACIPPLSAEEVPEGLPTPDELMQMAEQAQKNEPTEPPQQVQERVTPLVSDNKTLLPKPIKPIADIETNETGTLVLSIQDDQNQPSSAFVTIENVVQGSDGKRITRKREFISKPKQELTLPVGHYYLTITRGPRIAPWKASASVEANQTNTQQIKLEGYQSVWRGNWRMFDPYVVTDPSKADSSADANDPLFLSRLIEASGLAAAGCTSGSKPSSTGPRVLPAAVYSDNEYGDIYAIFPDGVEPVSQNEGEEFYETLARVKDAGGLTIAANPTIPSGQGGFSARIMPYLLLSGELLDGIDLGQHGEAISLWMRVMNQGIKLPALAGGPLANAQPIINTSQTAGYVRLPSRIPTAAEWFGGIRSGRLVVGNNAFLRIRIEGVDSGDLIPPSSSVRMIEINAIASSDPNDSIRKTELWYNGKCIDTFTGSDNQKDMTITTSQRLDQPGWILARYLGANKSHWAITNPVFIATGKEPPATQLAQVIFTIRSSTNFEEIPARITVENLGIPIRRLRLPAKRVALNLPPTARITIESDGYIAQKISLFREGGFANALQPNAGRLSLEDQIEDSINLIETMMRELPLEILMHPVTPSTNGATQTTPTESSFPQPETQP